MLKGRVGMTGIGVLSVLLLLSVTANADAIRTFTGHTGAVSAVAFSPDGARVLTGSTYDHAKLWNAATGAIVRDFTPDSSVNSVAYSLDGTRVVTGSGGNTVKLWNAETGALVRDLAPASGETSVAFSSDGTRALNGSYDKTAQLWDVETETVIRSFTGHTVAVSAVAFSPDGTEVLTGSWDKTAKLWNAATGTVVFTFSGDSGHTGSVTSVAFSPDGTKALTGSSDQTVKLWNTATGEFIRSINVASAVRAVAFSPDGTKVLTGAENNTATLWNASTGAELLTLTGHTSSVNAVAFSPDGTKALTGSSDNTAKLWTITVPVPDVSSQTQEAAEALLDGAKLVTGKVTGQCSNTIAEGLIVSQIPAADEQVQIGSAVALVVSTGLCNITVPNVAGLTQAAAVTALTGAGLTVGTVTEQCSNTVAADLVVSQGVAADQQVPFGSTVALTVSTGLCNVAVPGLTGLTQAAAGTALTGAGLTAGTVTEQCSNTVAAGLVISQEPGADEQVPFGSAVALVVSTGLCNVNVPNVVGLTQAAAGAAVTGAGLAAGLVTEQCSNTVAAGLVISQEPTADAQAPFGSAVAFVVSTGTCNVPVPNVVGLTQTAAGTAITGANLSTGTVTQQCSNTVAAGLVISQAPAADQQAPFGSPVALVVSTGVCNVSVPGVVGQTQTAANTALTGAGLTAGAVTQACSSTVAAGLVISQNPAAGAQTAFGSAVTLTVSTGPCATEGEVEGENPAPTEAELRDLLTASFDAVDGNGDSQISYAEALAALPGLPQAAFNAVDSDGNGQISLAEAGLDNGGCAGCSGGKSAFTPGGFQKLFGNLFLGGLSLMALLALKGHRQ